MSDDTSKNDGTLRDVERFIERFSDENHFERYLQTFIRSNPTARINDMESLGRLIADDMAESRSVSRRQASWIAKERELFAIHNKMLKAGR